MDRLPVHRRAALCGLIWLGASAFRKADDEETLGPDHADDPRWRSFEA